MCKCNWGRNNGPRPRRTNETQWKKDDIFGISLITQIAGKRDPVKDKEAQEWIEAILGEKFPAGKLYEDVLRDGVVCCNLINKIKPNSVPKVNDSGASSFKLMENVNNFQKALKAYGVPDQDVFQTVDLYEKKDISQVTNTFFALGRAVSIHWLEPIQFDRE